MSNDPVFKVGDVVEFEVGNNNRPRWDYEVDSGGKGVWKEGVVGSVESTFLVAAWEDPAFDGWCWPLQGHQFYTQDQWDRPGYLRHKQQPATERPSWDDTWFSVAHVISERATCKRKKVGAVVVKDNRLLVTGYNGSLPGEAHCLDVGCKMENGHCVRTIHAERNCLIQSSRQGVSLVGATLYSTLEPCPECRKLLTAAGVVDFKWVHNYGSKS